MSPTTSRFGLRGQIQTIVLLFSILLSAQSVSKELIVAGVEFPPLAFIDEQGGIRGPVVNQLNKVFDELNRPYRWVGYRATRLYREVANGTVDITYVNPDNDSLTSHLLTTDTPFATLTVKIYSRPGIPAPIKLSDIKGHQAIYFYYFENEGILKRFAAQQPSSLTEVPTREAGLRMLQAGRADYYLDFKHPVEKVIRELQLEPLESLTIAQISSYIGVSKRLPDAKELVEKLNKIMKLKASSNNKKEAK